jgi:hypothetical protein
MRQRALISIARFLCLAVLLLGAEALAYTANKVWVSRLINGTYRVTVEYTVPALQERRTAYTDFHSEQAASAYYWDLVRGADFYHDSPEARRFENPPAKPNPW